MTGCQRVSFPILVSFVVFCSFAFSACGGSQSNDEAGPRQPEVDQPEAWQKTPVIPELTGKLKTRFLRDVAVADRKGLRPDVFAKVGDSNTEYLQNLYGFGCRPVKYGDHEELEEVVVKYGRVIFDAASPPDCTPTNSFSRHSAATRSGTYSFFPVTRIRDKPEEYPDPACGPDETPLGCELRILRPRYTMVMTGTNDLSLDSSSGIEPGSRAAERLAPVIEQIRRAGSVPVLSTLPPIRVQGIPGIEGTGAIEPGNREIVRLAESRNILLVNLWRALAEKEMINGGLAADGIHLSAFGGEDSPDIFENSVNLTDEALRYGANRRNLIWLQVLSELDRVVDAAESKPG